MSKFKIIGFDGIPCPRCRQRTQIREHVAITEKHLRQPFYFSRWFYCVNKHCKVSLHMAEEFKVWNNNAAADKLRPIDKDARRRLKKIYDQLTPLGSG